MVHPIGDCSNLGHLKSQKCVAPVKTVCLYFYALLHVVILSNSLALKSER